MHHAHRSTRTRRSGSARALRMAAGLLVAGGSLCLFLGTAASASTVNGVATIWDPVNNVALASGGSATTFTVQLPANAACSGDTATDGYHVYSYLVPEGVNVTTLIFNGSAPPSQSFGFVSDIGTYYGPVNTAPTTGEIIGIPDFEWAPLVTDDGLTVSTLTTSGTTPGTWEAGLLCADSNATATTPVGAVTDNWNTQVTFTANGSDPNGFVWSAVPGTGTTTTTTTTTTAPTSTTTTQAGSTTTTTTQAGSTTTTTAVGSTVAASSTGDGSSSDGSSGSGTSTPLAFTGAPVIKYLGAGMLGIGIALILLGWGNRRVRLARVTRESPH
jgi:hypothetical protein